MKDNKPKYWKGLDEYNKEESFEKQRFNEFSEKLPTGKIINNEEFELTSTRRDFLKFMGYGITAATLAACTRTPVKKAIPYAIAPSDVDPSVANYYASTCSGCQARCSLLVKTREGRPIKIEGNPESPYSRGGVCATGQGTVLNLYDNSRLAVPMINKQAASWDALDKEVINKLKEIAAQGGNIRLLTSTITSPSTLEAIKQFTAAYPTARHIQYDPVSSYAILAAHEQTQGKAVIPGYKIENAKMIVSLGADFLGTWVSPVEFTKKYAEARRPEGEGEKLYHVQFETTLSLSGTNADMRVPLKPSQYGQFLVRLHNYIAQGTGGAQAGSSDLELMGNAIAHTAKMLLKNRGKSIVISDSNNVDHQLIIASINNMLGNYGTTLDMNSPYYVKQGNDKEVMQLVKDMNAGNVGALLVHDVNPAFTYPNANEFAEGLKKVKLTISFNDRMDETTELVQYATPDHHFLESWGDAMPKGGYVSLYQPTISPIFKTRAFGESLLTWAGQQDVDYHEFIRNYWQKNYFPQQSEFSNFETFWAHSLHQGFMNASAATLPIQSTGYTGDAAGAASRVSKALGEDEIELVLYEKVALRDGKHANNPWLQELPDPITKIVWDNYALVSPKFADKHGLTDQDLVEIKSGDYSVTLPIVRQPGQRNNTVAIAFGYGRRLSEEAGKVMREVGGKDVFPFAAANGSTFSYHGMPVTISGKMGEYELAMSQTHHHIEGRDLVRDVTIAEYAQGNVGAPEHGPAHHLISMWPGYRSPGHHWGMAIDLSACTGCGACVVSCQAENNIPVVGKDEVRRRREMHWLRIDRYYSVADEKKEYLDDYKSIDKSTEEGKANWEDVKVVFQPMLCQHCNNAPCETVCPVNATSHSNEGLNMQSYQRCVGTRYCANNCPYKVRRFNWFDYAKNGNFDYNMNSDLGRMVLNPDVTVRMRGVMEKCTMCVQRIQLGKLQAKKDGRPVQDGEIKTACQQTCPANAIIFGDMNDPNSEISKLMENKRTYDILSKELNTRPNVAYMTKVRIKPEEV